MAAEQDEANGNGDLGFGIAVDGSGDAYVVGQTYSGNSSSTGPEFPGVASCGAWGTTGKNNGMSADTGVGFVSELAAGGDSLVYSCYIPGSHNAMAARVALVPGCASDCDAFIVGSTQSTVADGFVVTANAPQANLATGEGGLSNAFMMIVGGDGSGATPVFSTYYGGTGNGTEGDIGLGITVASLNEVAIPVRRSRARADRLPTRYLLPIRRNPAFWAAPLAAWRSSPPSIRQRTPQSHYFTAPTWAAPAAPTVLPVLLTATSEPQSFTTTQRGIFGSRVRPLRRTFL